MEHGVSGCGFNPSIPSQGRSRPRSGRHFSLKNSTIPMTTSATTRIAKIDQSSSGIMGARSELTHEAQLAAGALVVVELGVGRAHLVHQGDLRAEAQYGEGAVVDREAQGAGPVRTRRATERERGPVAPVAAIMPATIGRYFSFVI